MATTKTPRPQGEIRVVGDALTFAIQHNLERKGIASVALIEKYVAKLGEGARGALLQMQVESYGLFCDQIAAGFKAWADGDVPEPDDGADDDIPCACGESDMHIEVTYDGVREHVCAFCGVRERR